MTTAGTEPVEFQPVGLDNEAVIGGDLLLEAFDVAIGELHDLAATGADEMIMVSFMRNVVILRLRAEMPRLGQPGFAKQVEGTIDRRQAQVGIFFCQLVIHFLGRDVLLLQKRIEDQFALAGEL